MVHSRLVSQACAARCDKMKGCQAVNIYYERSPSLDPGLRCKNPSSVRSKIPLALSHLLIDFILGDLNQVCFLFRTHKFQIRCQQGSISREVPGSDCRLQWLCQEECHCAWLQPAINHEGDQFVNHKSCQLVNDEGDQLFDHQVIGCSLDDHNFKQLDFWAADNNLDWCIHF